MIIGNKKEARYILTLLTSVLPYIQTFSSPLIWLYWLPCLCANIVSTAQGIFNILNIKLWAVSSQPFEYWKDLTAPVGPTVKFQT